MDENTIIKLVGNYFNLINDAIINIEEIFVNQTNAYEKSRQTMVENVINLRRQQLVLIISACSNDLSYEKRLWQLVSYVIKNIVKYFLILLFVESYKILLGSRLPTV